MAPRKYLVELIGAFFLVFTIGQCVIDVNPESGVIAALAIGSALMVMIYAGGHISGGHYNPAVTLAVWIRGRCPMADVIPYMIAQVLGAVLAAALVIYLKGHQGATPEADPDPIKSFIVELLFTFALAYVVLNSATSKATAGNSFYGLAIGFTVMVGAFAVGSISGGAFNPAVAIAVGVMGLAKTAHVVVLLAATFAGGALAGLTFNFLNPDDR
ncbi:MIP/aquaporin family protein [Tundrisphaera lichenicola]|uniref:MIP/aquaporin family protein n=1 Tax=Tundrisphaera lichenicola TaxID=2029860 RepID=UPI003EBDFF6F